MALQMVDAGLLDIAHIACAQVYFSDREIQGDELPERRMIRGCSEDDVLPVVFQFKDLVIGLTVFRREHDAGYGDV